MNECKCPTVQCERCGQWMGVCELDPDCSKHFTKDCDLDSRQFPADPTIDA